MTAQTAPTADPKANAIVEVRIFDDWEDRYQLLIDQGENWRRFRVVFVMTRTGFEGANQWFISRLSAIVCCYIHGRIRCRHCSGLVALLLRVYSDARWQSIRETEPKFRRKSALTHICQQPVKMGF